MLPLALPFLLALFVSAALVPLSRAVAVRLGQVVQGQHGPRDAKPKARFGGVAIALTLFACSLAVGAVPALPVLFACSVALFLLGTLNDVFTTKATLKLLVQVTIASIFLLFDYRLYWADSITLDSLITVFWIVTITSAFDLLDNMDGLCAGIALIAGTAFLFTVLPVDPGSPLFLQMQYLAILLGAIAGFLIYNIHPASVAMGESGSLLIGLNMAAMTLQIVPGTGSDLLSIVAVPVLVLLVPLFDGALVGVSRLLPPSLVATRAHSSHRLVAIGMSERAAVGLLWLLAAVGGVIGVLADRNRQGLGIVAAAVFIIALAMLAVYLARVQIDDGVDPTRLRGTLVPLGIESDYRRRLVEMLLDVLLVSIAYYGAYRLRFEGTPYAPGFAYFIQSFPVVLGAQMVALFVVGVYRGTWRYFSLSDGVTFVKGVGLGVLATQVILVSLYRFEGYTQSVFVVYGMLLVLLLGGSRASYRLISEFVQRRRSVGRRLIVYGADMLGLAAARHLLGDAGSTYRMIGFVDDNAAKRDVRIHGYPVIGGYDHLVGMIMAGEVDAVAVTDGDAATSDLAWLCARHDVSLHRLAMDWRDVPAREDAAAAAAMSASAAEPRLVRGRDRRHAASAVAEDGSAAAVSRRRGPWRQRTLPSEQPVPPIRVIHIITRLILGGAQENTLYTAIGQHRSGRFDVTVLCGVDEAGEGNMFTEVNKAGVRTVVLPSLVREVRPLADLKAFWEAYRFLKKGSYAVVHTHSSKAGIIGRVAARAAGVPVIVHTLHGLAFHEFQAAWKNWLYIALERLCAPTTHRLISVSDRVSQTALAHGIGTSEQYVTIHSGIDLDLFLSIGDRLSVAEAKIRVGIPPDAPVVGKIARLFALKGHEQFLAVAADVAQAVPEAYFLLVGDGPLRDQLQADFRSRGLADRVVMLGRVPPERVPDCIQAMDVVVHTSLREGIARVLPQAGAVGKPVVGFDLDGASEVIRDGVSGYLVPPLDTRGVARRTIELLGNPERRWAFGQAGRAFASDHFSIERMVERVSAAYLELLASRAAEGAIVDSVKP